MQVPQFPVPFAMPSRSGSYARFRQLDLSGISAIDFAVNAPTQYGAVGGKIEVRIDSETGALVGETETVAPQTTPNAPPIVAHAPLKPTTGMHDVYFVFRNDQAKPQAMLFIVTTATVVGGPSASAPSAAPSPGAR
jgi:cytochrome c